MIKHDVQQGSPEWLALRLGMPTASDFHRFVGSKGELSRAKKGDGLSLKAKSYAYTLVAEQLLQRPLDSLEQIEWIEHGKSWEGTARAQYGFENGVTPEIIGFATTDDGKAGASPDSLVGGEGLLEIKCVKANTQIAYLEEGFDEDYLCQVQGQMFVTGRAWCDWYSWNAEMPPVTVRIERDDAFCENLAASISEFVEIKNGIMQRVKDKGFFMTRQQIVPVRDHELSEQRDFNPLAGG